MAEENKNITEVEAAPEAVKESKSKKAVDKDKKPNFFVRIGKKIAKLCKDMAGELKKVTWPTKKELFSYTMAVIAVVVGLRGSFRVIISVCSSAVRAGRYSS